MLFEIGIIGASGQDGYFMTRYLLKKGLSVLNTPGTIDADYRGEIKVILINLSKEKFIVENGLRIAQMVLCPVSRATLEESKELSDTGRGSGGFGSTGSKID